MKPKQKPRQFDPYEGLHTCVPSETSPKQTIKDGKVTGHFVCTVVICGFGGTLIEAIAHTVKNQARTAWPPFAVL